MYENENKLNLDENTMIDEDVDSLEMLDSEDLQVKRLNRICNVFILILCCISAYLLNLDIFFEQVMFFILICSGVVIPLIFGMLTLLYKKIDVPKFKIILILLKKSALYLLFFFLWILFWGGLLNNFDYALMTINIIISFVSWILLVYIGMIVFALSLIFYNLKTSIKESKLDKNVVVNLDTVKVVPIIMVLILQVCFVLSMLFGIVLDISYILDNAIILFSSSFTYGLQLIIVVLGIVSAIFDIKLKEVYKYVAKSLLVTILFLFGPLSIVIIPLMFITVLIGMVFGTVLNFIFKRR